MHKNKKQIVGKEGEDRAVIFLQNNGYHILDRNFRTRFGEIDIVALENNDLVFIEVKTRTNYSFGEPFLSVDSRKQRKLIKTALHYIKTKNVFNRNLRFDVVSQTDNKTELIKNAFFCPVT